MTSSLTSSLVTTAVGVLLLTAVLQTWRRSAAGSVRLLVVQGIALATLVAALGISHGDVQLLLVAAVVVLDKGIAMVAFLTSNGLPLTVELGATLDVLLIVVILRALTARMRVTHGGTSVDEMTELRD